MRISDWSSDVCSSDLESAADPPMGYFEVLRPAPEKLAQKPEEDSSNDRTRQGSVPRLARLLWRLLHISGLNRVPPLTEDHADHSISDEFRTLLNGRASCRERVCTDV